MDFSADIRGFIQYVPQFRGKVFVVDIDWSGMADSIKAEVLMDLKALQSVGVKLVISLLENQVADFYKHSVELEFRVSSGSKPQDVDVVNEVLERGQAVAVAREGDLISDSLVSLAVGVKAAKLIVMDESVACADGCEPIKFLHYSAASSVGSDIFKRAGAACEKGVPRVHLLDVSQAGVLVNELFSTEGVGTMVYADSYRQVRALREEDISELLGMIGRSVQNTALVPRTYEEIRDSLSSYYVMEVDDNVVGCAALYEYPDCAEIACLYVKKSHEGTGYGESLVKSLEGVAKDKKVAKVFALSNRAAAFFKNKLGYSEASISDLPDSRRETLEQSGRDSLVFTKEL